MASNEEAGLFVRQPRSVEERKGRAREYCTSGDVTIPVLVDSLDNAASEAYSAFPDRLYLIDRSGRVVYKGGRGPFGFDVPSLEQALCLTLLRDRGRRF